MATALSNLEEFITCEVCLGRFEGRDPRSLGCLHAFCLQCLEDVHAAANKRDPSSSNQIRCPKCQQISDIPASSVDNFPKYFQANQVSDIIGDIEEQLARGRTDQTKRGRDICTICSKGLPKAYCFTCGYLFCGACRPVHDSNKDMKGHALTEVTDENIHTLACQGHGEMPVRYCLDCLEPICKRCQFGDHSSHDTQEVAEKVDNSDSFRLVAKLKDQIDNAQKFLVKIEDSEKDFDSDVESLKRNIGDQKAFRIQQIEQEYDALILQVDHFKENAKEPIAEVKAVVQNSKMTCEEIHQRLQRILLPVHEFNSLGLKQESTLVSGMANSVPDTDLDFYVSCPEVPQFISSFEQPVLGKIANDQENEAKGDAKLLLELPILTSSASEDESDQTPKDQGAEVGSSADRVMHEDVYYPRLKRAWVMGSGQVTCMSVYDEGVVCIIDDVLTSVKFGEKKCFRAFGLRQENETWLLFARHEESGDMALALSVKRKILGKTHRVRWYTRHSQSFFVEGTVDSMPVAMAFASNGCPVVGTSKNAVQMLGRDGKWVWKLDYYAKIDHIACELQSSRIYVTNSDWLCVYNENGHPLRSFYRHKHEELIRGPLGCVASDGNRIIYHDKTDNSLKYLDREYNTSSDMNVRFTDSETPTCMTMSRDGRLFVGTKNGVFCYSA